MAYKSQQIVWFGLLAFGLGFFLCPFGADIIWKWVIDTEWLGGGSYLKGMQWMYAISIGLMIFGLLIANGFKGMRTFMRENPEIPVIMVVGCIMALVVLPRIGFIGA